MTNSHIGLKKNSLITKNKNKDKQTEYYLLTA